VSRGVRLREKEIRKGNERERERERKRERDKRVN